MTQICRAASADLATLEGANHGRTSQPARAGAHRKNDRRKRAPALRLAGWTYAEIVAELGVSKSSVSLWVRDLPKPSRDRAAHARMMNERRWEPYRRRREAERQQTRTAAMAEVGRLSDRELLFVGAALYWAEGTKDKAGRATRRTRDLYKQRPQDDQVVSSLAGSLGVPRSQLSFRVSIHESAEVAAAHRFWGEVVGVSVDSLLRPTIKRHRPRTVRHNLGKDYHGCLVVKVYRSAELYRRSRVGGEAVSSR